MKSLISPGVGELLAAVKYRYIDSKETGFFTEIKGFKGDDAVFSSIGSISPLQPSARNWSFEAGGRRQEAEGKRQKEGARRKEPEEVFLQI
ncbi:MULTISPECIES: hypothetical protein [unclassified Microcoleus]|uniref:hypothetical protein n=1 Tax=unclassified Microcoleus TaxID=2642155 RepID=UPI002FD6770D